MDVLTICMNWFPVHGDQVKGVARGGIPASVTGYLRGHLLTWLSLTRSFVPFNHTSCAGAQLATAWTHHVLFVATPL